MPGLRPDLYLNQGFPAVTVNGGEVQLERQPRPPVEDGVPLYVEFGTAEDGEPVYWLRTRKGRVVQLDEVKAVAASDYRSLYAILQDWPG